MSDQTQDTLLPRDEFSIRLRELVDNPGAVRAQSRVDITDFYGRSETWTIDTFRHDGMETAFLLRMGAGESLRLFLPPAVMQVITRQHDGLTGKVRRRGAKQAVQTRIARGDTIGNVEALRKARKARKARNKK